MKKILKALCIFAVLMSLAAGSLPAYAAEGQKNYKSEIQTLTGFGIISGYSSDNYVNIKSITYNDFLSYLIKARYADSLSGDAVELAKETGLVDEKDNIKGSAAVTTDIAVKAAVRALGYEAYVNLKNSTYFGTAKEIGLLKGTTIKENEKLNSDNMLVMLSNMIDIDLFAQVSGEYKQIDDTLISKFHRLTKVSGVVTANEFTGIYSPQEGRPGYIRINDTYYETDGADFNDMLGMNVEAYYSEGSFDTVKCVFEKGDKNKEFVISDEMFCAVDDNITRISYYKDEVSRKVLTKRLSSTLKVIYNGKAAEKYDAKLFDIPDGEIRLLDNDGNGTYDFAFIADYELILVNRVDASNRVLTGEYELKAWSGTEENLKKLDFSKMETDKNLFVYKGGKKVGFSDISENDVVSMARSAYGDDNLVKLYVTRQTQNIDVESVDEDEIKTGEATFKLNGNYADLVKSGNGDIVKIEAGNSYKVYLDRNGRIAGAEKIGTGGEDYILIYSVYTTEPDDRTVVRCVDSANEYREFAFAPRVRIDDARYEDEQAVYSCATAVLGRVVKVKYNGENEISRMKTAVRQSSTDTSETFNYADKQTLTYRSGAGTVSFGGKYYVDGNTIIFATLDNTSKRKEDWLKVMLSRLYLTDNKSYTITPYAIDEYGYAKVILLEASTASKTLNMLVDRVIVGLNDEEEPVQKLIGPVGSIVSLEVPGIDSTVFAGLRRGDYVTVTIDYEGNATKAAKIYSAADGIKYSRPAESAFYSSGGQYMGILNKIDYSAMRMQLTFGADSSPKNFDMQWLEPTVYIYDDGEMTIGNVNDLEVGNMIVMTTSYDRPSTIIAYK